MLFLSRTKATMGKIKEMIVNFLKNLKQYEITMEILSLCMETVILVFLIFRVVWVLIINIKQSLLEMFDVSASLFHRYFYTFSLNYIKNYIKNEKNTKISFVLSDKLCNRSREFTFGEMSE